jgi:hypothetical protein
LGRVLCRSAARLARAGAHRGSSTPTPAATPSCSRTSSSARGTSWKSPPCSRCSWASRTAGSAASKWASSGPWWLSCARARSRTA